MNCSILIKTKAQERINGEKKFEIIKYEYKGTQKKSPWSILFSFLFYLLLFLSFFRLIFGFFFFSFWEILFLVQCLLGKKGTHYHLLLEFRVRKPNKSEKKHNFSKQTRASEIHENMKLNQFGWSFEQKESSERKKKLFFSNFWFR